MTDDNRKTHIGRFAPTPSGALHLGNIMTALIAWLNVRKKGGKFLLRIEDLDRDRCPKGADEEILRTMDWLGLSYEREVLLQSERADVYANYFDELDAHKMLYPCYCSRAELHAATAPHGDTPVYSGKCRSLPDGFVGKKSPAYRVIVPDMTVTVNDGIQGTVKQKLTTECGDFIVRRADKTHAYQLAVVVDDGLQGVTEVVRGRDLLTSAPRQKWLFETLGFTAPDFYHVPLLLDANGERMSKRDRAMDVAYVRTLYPDPRVVIGLIAFNCGLIPKYEPVSLEELLGVYDVKNIKTNDIVLDTCRLW